MKVLVKNGSYALCYSPSKVNRYSVYSTCQASLSSDLKIHQEICTSPNFTSKMKSYFTKQQVNTAIAKVHAMKYVSHTFKA